MTPVSVLQELCAKKGVTPQYDTIGQEGDSHQPIFTIRCIAGGSMGSGQGHSKKDAKQAAAKDLLEQLGVDTSAFESQQTNRSNSEKKCLQSNLNVCQKEIALF